MTTKIRKKKLTQIWKQISNTLLRNFNLGTSKVNKPLHDRHFRITDVFSMPANMTFIFFVILGTVVPLSKAQLLSPKDKKDVRSK